MLLFLLVNFYFRFIVSFIFLNFIFQFLSGYLYTLNFYLNLKILLNILKSVKNEDQKHSDKENIIKFENSYSQTSTKKKEKDK